MKDFKLESIEIGSIDMDKCYFNPGCATSVHNPKSEERIFKLLKDHFDQIKMHKRCCKHDPNLPDGSTIINNCAGCDRRFRSLYEGIQTISLWEVLSGIDDLQLPDYNGIQVSVQDSCSYRPKPQVHKAVRTLLKRMNIQVVETKAHGTQSICCGDNFYTRIPDIEVRAFQKTRVSQMPCNDVVVYCVSCIKSMSIGGKTAHHLLDLILEQPTFVGETDLETYHTSIQFHIDKSVLF